MTFVERLDKAGLVHAEKGLGIEHPQRAAMIEADAQIETRVKELDGEMFAPVSAADCVELGRKVVSGELKPKTVADRVASAATKVNPDGSSRRSHVLKGVRAQLVADVDRPEWSVRGLRKGFAVAAQDAVEKHVKALLAALDETPASVREPLLASSGAGFDFEQFSPSDLSPDEFAALKRVQDLAVGERGGRNKDMLYNLVPIADAIAGRDAQQRYDWFGNLKRGMDPDFIEAVLWTDDVELMAAGYGLDGILKRRVAGTLDPIVDPGGMHREVYEDRLKRYNHVKAWRNEFVALREMHAGVSRGKQSELRKRLEMSPDEVLAAMRKEGEL